MPEDHPPAQQLNAEKRRLEALTPEQRKKEFKGLVDQTIALDKKLRSEQRILINKGVDSPQHRRSIQNERAEMLFALGTAELLAGLFGDKYMALYVHRISNLFQALWTMEGAGAATAAVAGNQYLAVGIAVVGLLQLAQEMTKPDQDPLLEGIKLILEEIKTVKEQIADLGRHLDTKLDIYFGSLFDRLTTIELNLESLERLSIEISSKIDFLADQVSEGFREIKEREFSALLLKCFDDKSIVRKIVVTEKEATDCLKNFATNLINPSQQRVRKSLPELQNDQFWPFSENAEAFRLWLIDFAQKEKLEGTRAGLVALGNIPSASFWASNANALYSLIEQHPWIASATLADGLLGKGADVGRRTIAIYHALGPRKSWRDGITLGEEVLLALVRASRKTQVNTLALIEKNPWQIAAGDFNPLHGFYQTVSHTPHFTKGPLPTCDGIKGTEGFVLDAPPLTWNDVAVDSVLSPGSGGAWATMSPNQKLYQFQKRNFMQPVKANIENAFRSQRLPLPGALDKKLPTWALNADKVRPTSVIACLSRLSMSGYSLYLVNDLVDFSFDYAVNIDTWLAWDERENPAAEPKRKAALVSRQQVRDRAGSGRKRCVWEFPREVSFPALVFNGTYSFASAGHSGTLKICSAHGAVKDAWATTATETATDKLVKDAREQAKAWISAYLADQRSQAAKRAQEQFKADLGAARQFRAAFSALLQVGFWPELISDPGFRTAIEATAQLLDADRNLTDTLAGLTGSQKVNEQFEIQLAKLQQWMSDQSRNYDIPRQTRGLKQVVDRLEKAQVLVSAMR